MTIASLRWISLAMNTATHDVSLNPSHGAPRIETSRAGAGRIDVATAITSSLIAYETDEPGAVSVSFGAVGPALGEGRAVAAAMDALARQPESAGTISRTLFVGLAMIETMAIYCLVIALLVLFANPFVK